MIVLLCCQYAAPYEGNFIKSLTALESRLKKDDGEVIYVFPELVTIQPWWSIFSKGRKVYTTSNDVRNSVSEIRSIILQEKPHIIHSHFDGYDIPIAKCLEQTKYSAHVIWHLHNYLSFHPNPCKALYQVFCFLNHFFYWGKKVHIISVCEETFIFVHRFRSIFGHSFPSWLVIPNGIDLCRISSTNTYNLHKPVSFLAFGGRNDDKRIDLILEACSLVFVRHPIRLYVTKGVDTEKVIFEHFGNNIPDWCILLEQNSNVCDLFSLADCFISSSVHETFSYGICEASIYGLPVIQSDIEGTKWNASNPSTFVFKSGDVEDLSKMMIRVIELDQKQMEERCRITRENNMVKYSIDNWCNEIIHFYEKVLEK